jgi:calcium-dependent protein kinase
LHFNEEEAALMIKQVLIVINYLHNTKIIHRDIKPDNILIESMPKEGDLQAPWQIKLIDFGTATRFKKGQRLSQTFGTSYYVAPEVLDGNYNEKCDIWSCGVMLYMMLSGRPPFTGSNDKEITDNVRFADIILHSSDWRKKSRDCIDFIRRLLIRDPNKRSSAEDAL